MDRVFISQIAVYALQTPGLVRVTRVMGRPARSAGSRVDSSGRSEFNNYASNSLSF